MVILLRRTLSVFYEAGRILDGMVTAGSLDKAYAGVLATEAQSRARAPRKTGLWIGSSRIPPESVGRD
jgi:hypothetical protein